MTFREMGLSIGDKVRFIDDRPWETRTIQTETQLDEDHLLPWIIIKQAAP